MQNITAQQQFANAIIELLANYSNINVLLTTNTTIAVAAKYKSTVSINKISTVNATLYANANAYLQLVQASASKIASNASNANNVVNFNVSESKYKHLPNAHCIAMLNDMLYLQAICNSASSQYFVNNAAATKEQVAQYLTPSAADKLLHASNVQHNVTNDIQHTVIVRTYKFSSIQSIQLLDTAQNKVINNSSFSLA